MADEPPEHLLEDVERWQQEEDDYQRSVDRIAMIVTILGALAVFLALLMMLNNG